MSNVGLPITRAALDAACRRLLGLSERTTDQQDRAAKAAVLQAAWEHGHALAEAERLIRADRLQRGGRPVVDEELIRREVIATQRLAGVDARPHLESARDVEQELREECLQLKDERDAFRATIEELRRIDRKNFVTTDAGRIEMRIELQTFGPVEGFPPKADPSRDQIRKILLEVDDRLGDGFDCRNAAENPYCPNCAKDVERYHDQVEHREGCAFVELKQRIAAAIAELA